MKLKLIIILLLTLNISMRAQDTIVFVDTASVWYGYYEEMDCGHIYNQHYYFYSIGSDTTISDKEYKKLYYNRSYNFKLYCGAIREENRKIYFRCDYNLDCFCCRHGYDTLDILLYDFNVDVGDTVYHNTGHYNVITEIDSILLLDGNYRKRYETGYDFWIEGIGSTRELFEPIIVIGEWWAEFACFEYNGEILYSSPYHSTCYTNTTDHEYKNIHIYPNPFREKLYIKMPDDLKLYDIKIFDILGQNIFSSKLSGSEIVINEKLKEGIYSIYIETAKYSVVRKVIKIN